jgi:hypothetical protein
MQKYISIQKYPALKICVDNTADCIIAGFVLLGTENPNYKYDSILIADYVSKILNGEIFPVNYITTNSLFPIQIVLNEEESITDQLYHLIKSFEHGLSKEYSEFCKRDKRIMNLPDSL